MVAVGIDIGSRLSRVAVLGSDGAPVLCPDQEQSSVLQTPSVVHIGTGIALVGVNAEELIEESPRLPFVRNPSAFLESSQPALTDASGRSWQGDALLAVLLKKLGRDVRAFTNEAISTAALVVPGRASERERQGIRDAALLAGFSRPIVIAGPVAAAQYHAFTGGTEEQLLVVDVGAGGHDCAIVTRTADGFDLAVGAGSSVDGSQLIDRGIVQVVAEQFRAEHGIDVLRDPANEIPLQQLGERIKLALLHSNEVPVLRQMVVMGRKVVDVVLTRRHVGAIAGHVLQSVKRSCQDCLSAASGPVAGVILTGGARQLFGLRQCLAELAPEARVFERECAAVFGAALAADEAQSRAAGSKPAGLVGDIGMRVWNAVKNAPDFRVLISTATTLPTQKTITLYTRRANQERLVLDLVKRLAADQEGESLATFEFGPFEDMPKDHPVEIVISCDLDAIIKVTARDPQTRREISQYSSGAETLGAERLARQRDLVASLSVNE